MKGANKPNSVAGYWSGIHDALDGRLLSVKEYLRHPASGHNAEDYFRDLFRQYVPRRFAVETGFVVNAQGQRSDFLDLLIVDSLHIPPLSAEPHFKVFPAEAVVGVIEITSAPKAKVTRSGIAGKISKLEDDILKVAKLREIAKDRQYLQSVTVQTDQGVVVRTEPLFYSLCPRSFLITFGDEWTKRETYETNLLNALNSAKSRRDHVWVNAVWSMRHGMFHFKPHTEFQCETIKKNPMLEFVLFVNNAISDFYVARIDLRRYRPTLPGEVE